MLATGLVHGTRLTKRRMEDRMFSQPPSHASPHFLALGPLFSSPSGNPTAPAHAGWRAQKGRAPPEGWLAPRRLLTSGVRQR